MDVGLILKKVMKKVVKPIKNEMKELAEKIRKETGVGFMDWYTALKRNNVNYEDAKKYLNSSKWKHGKWIDWKH